MTVDQKCDRLRQAMLAQSVDAYYIPSSDPHNSEYLPPYWQARAWISGFTGSAGTFIITSNFAGLWTDGRYFIQAEKELAESNITLFKMGTPDTPSPTEWLKSNCRDGDTIGFDGRTVSIDAAEKLKNSFKKKSIHLSSKLDLIDEIWDERPSLPQESLFDYPVEIAGASRKEKLQNCRQKMKDDEIDIQLICSLDDVAWMSNLRGRDIDHTPVFYAFLIITQQEATLYVDDDKCSQQLQEQLIKDGYTLRPYDAIYQDLAHWPKGATLHYDPASTNQKCVESWAPSSPKLYPGLCYPTLTKAQKNPSEIKAYRQCMITDGIAMVKFLHWLEEQVPTGAVTECTAEDAVDAFRAESPEFIETSFKTISAQGSNGAMMHYSTSKDHNASLEQKSFYLVDSGGQYLQGTTDLTRTISFGPLSEAEKRDYTLVLKAMICLSKTIFRQGVAGVSLDTIARGILWQHGIDYNSGTGHGVGMCLGVHEGPASISPRPNANPLQLDMLITNEPGIYREGQHGIRIENILRVIEHENNAFGKFWRFETMTLTPICQRPILKDMLQEDEVLWLNHYHKRVLDTLSPHLDAKHKAWLEAATSPL